MASFIDDELRSILILQFKSGRSGELKASSVTLDVMVSCVSVVFPRFRAAAGFAGSNVFVIAG